MEYIAELYRGVTSQPQVVRAFIRKAETLAEFVKAVKMDNGYNICKEKDGVLYFTNFNSGLCGVIDCWIIKPIARSEYKHHIEAKQFYSSITKDGFVAMSFQLSFLPQLKVTKQNARIRRTHIDTHKATGYERTYLMKRYRKVGVHEKT